MTVGRLEAPAHYDDERRQIWAETVTRLTTGGRIFRADPEILGTYVEAVRSHRQASRLLAQTNVMITRDGVAMENPALAIQRKSAESMARASRSLGLDRIPVDDPSMTDAEPAPIHDGKCGGKKKQGGGTCTQPAGWGTPHAGSGRCKLHGGCAPSSVIAGVETQARRLLYQRDAAPVVNPLEALQLLAGRALALEQFFGDKANELKGLRYEGGAGGEQLRAEVAVLERAMDRAGRLLLDIAKLNVEERLASVREKTAAMLEQALQSALAASGCDLGGQQRAREEFRRRLRVA